MSNNKTAQEELKDINAQKKELNEKQKALRVKLDKTKVARAEARTTKADSRKGVLEAKKSLRDLMSRVYPAFSSNNEKTISELSDELEESSTILITKVRAFAKACSDPSVEDGEEDEDTSEL